MSYPVGPRTYAAGGPDEVIRKNRVRRWFELQRRNIRRCGYSPEKEAERLAKLAVREQTALDGDFHPSEDEIAAYAAQIAERGR